MRVLVIDTATRRGTVAAVAGGELVAGGEHDGPAGHAEKLFGLVERVLSQARWGQGPELMVVGMGPGSFTGVRVGMAAAKGLAFARKIPLLGVVSLDAMAYAAGAERRPCVALLDAKKEEVFLASYAKDGIRTEGPLHIARDAVEGWLADRSTAAGALTVIGEVVEGLTVGASTWHRSGECDLPGPLAMASLAEQAWRRDPVDLLESLEPLYVRPPDITLPASKSTKAAPCA